MIVLERIRPLVFWPTFLVLVAGVVLSFVDLERFLGITRALNERLLANFSWLFSLGSFYLLLLVVFVYFSPLAKVRIPADLPDQQFPFAAGQLVVDQCGELFI